jgi:UDP-2,4-diacetamido-2,4,6-trideoxy-beta-L-altropyranose hydrolase
MRCLTLAEELMQAGSDVRFITRSHEGNLNSLIHKKRFKLYELPSSYSATLKEAARREYARWLGTTQEADAAETVAILKKLQPDWLIVDHYAIDETWEQVVRPYVKRIMVIDDLANRKHDCDLLLDQNYVRGEHQRYAGLVSPACTVLAGPHYALLRKEFAEARKNLKNRDGSVHRVFVFFGGVDPDNMTGKALEALSAPEFSHVHVDIVIGAANPHRETISQGVKQRSLTTLHVQVENIAELMAQADLALCAGGTTTWERFCLGLPSLVVTIADNQVPFTRDLHEDGLLRWVGTSQDVDVPKLRKGISNGLQDTDRNRQETETGMKLVDGNGAQKVAANLLVVDDSISDLVIR